MSRKNAKTRTMNKKIQICLNIAFFALVPLITIITTEWIARGTLGAHERDLGFFEALAVRPWAFLIAYLLLLLIYTFIAFLFNSHIPAVLCVFLLGNVPAIITYFKLSFRNEPFLPWDLYQINQLVSITGELDFVITAPMIISLLIIIALFVLSRYVKLFEKTSENSLIIKRLCIALVLLILFLCMIFFVFLNSAATQALGIKEDMWMQDRYYRFNGVITGFLTNLQMLAIQKPENYSQQTVEEILQSVQENPQPLFENSPAQTGSFTQQNPDIIYIMAEGFWDMQLLPGIEYDRPLTENLQNLAKEGASGYALSPSYGGGTCDVEFELLTGFSMEFVPSGSKPYQQYINSDVFSIAWHLKDQGYETLAIHGYGERFWNRDVAYPRLGIDDFISEEDMQGAHRERGFISDEAMVDRIIQEQSQRASDENPLFIHAVTMQNHTTYSPNRYPENERVKITQNSANLSDDIIGQMEDCATGIYEMDKALGMLTDYLRTIERPTIVVFFGDHLNPMSDGYGIFEDTGFIEQGDTSNPKMFETPLLIWSNQSHEQINLGTISAYNITPLMMDLYGLEKPLYFEFLAQQMNLYTAASKGTIYYANGNVTREVTQEQENLLYSHSVLQYDLLFGQEYQTALW